MHMDHETTFTCPASLDIAAAQASHERLQALLAADGDIRVVLEDLRRVDTAGVQLLWAFVRDVRAAGRTVHWVGASDALVGAARLLGIDARLGAGAADG